MARSTAHHILCLWDPEKRWAEDLLQQYTSRLRDDDRRFANRLVIGTLKSLRALDYVIAPRLRDGLESVPKETLWALRLGVEQLLHTRVPSHAAVAETVDLVKRNQRGLVNAILRRIGRENETVTTELRNAPADIRHSIPHRLFQRWVDLFGEQEAEKLAAFINQPAPTTFVLNTLHQDVSQKLAEDQVDYRELPDHPGYFETIDGAPIPDTWFSQGLIYAQDPAAGIAVNTLTPKSGETILDCCAAPGGKTFLIARAINNQGTVIACDNDPSRAERLDGNCQRLGISCAKIEIADWSSAKGSSHITVPSAVIIDAPCSNTGVLRRRVDARYRASAINPASITKLQKSILENVLTRLPQDGRCVYSTCSIEPMENGETVRQVVHQLKDHSLNFELENESQSLPHRDGIDGHYSILITKR